MIYIHTIRLKKWLNRVIRHTLKVIKKLSLIWAYTKYDYIKSNWYFFFGFKSTQEKCYDFTQKKQNLAKFNLGKIL